MKKLKHFVIALILPVMFVICACGGGQLATNAQADIGNSSDYFASTPAQALSFLQAETTSAELASYRMTVDIGFGAMKMNGIVKETENGMQMAMEFKMSAFGVSASGKMYLNDGVVYAEYDSATAEENGLPSNKVKANMENENNLNQTQFGLFQQYDVNQLIGNAEWFLGEDNVEVFVNDEGDNVIRYKITMTDNNFEVDGQPAVYTTFIVFENNELVSIKDTSSMHTAIIESFDGEIEFPDFSGYKEVTFEQFVGSDSGF